MHVLGPFMEWSCPCTGEMTLSTQDPLPKKSYPWCWPGLSPCILHQSSTSSLYNLGFSLCNFSPVLSGSDPGSLPPFFQSPPKVSFLLYGFWSVLFRSQICICPKFPCAHCAGRQSRGKPSAPVFLSPSCHQSFPFLSPSLPHVGGENPHTHAATCLHHCFSFFSQYLSPVSFV